jgi:hypothetical protein
VDDVVAQLRAGVEDGTPDETRARLLIEQIQAKAADDTPEAWARLLLAINPWPSSSRDGLRKSLPAQEEEEA